MTTHEQQTTQKVIPLALLDCVRVYAQAGYATFPCVLTDGKKLPVKGCKWTESGVDDSPNSLKYPFGAFGVRLKPDDLIVDLDPRNMQGRKVWSELKSEIPELEVIEKRATIVQTASGGVHIYLRKPADMKIKKSLSAFPGIDFLSVGTFVVGAGSIGEQNLYTFLTPPFAVVEAPVPLLQKIKRVDTVVDAGVVAHKGYADTPENVGRYVEYLVNTATIAVEGENGDVTTFKTACRGRDYNLTARKTWECMRDNYNARCRPPWDEQELFRKVVNAYTYNEHVPGTRDPNIAFPVVPVAPDAGTVHSIGDLDRTKTGKFLPTLRNAFTLLTHEIGLQGRFAQNLFTDRIDVIGHVPWEHERINQYRQINDLEIENIRLYLATKFSGVEFSTLTTWKAVALVAERNRRHPVREYVSSLTWDGTPRVDTWLTEYCKCVDNVLTRALGRKFLLALIARAYDPGCQWDYVLVLEGAQGIGKSTVCRILGGEWFGDMELNVNDKDSLAYLHEHWVVELSEMSMTRKTSSDKMKHFIARRYDDLRLPYARERTKYPRQCVFIGTINPDSVGYLYDTTGNRRFWCVRCNGMIAMNELRADRDQLIAEAYHHYQKGETLKLTSEQYGEIEYETMKRLAEDPWMAPILEWFEQNENINRVTTKQVYEEVLNGSIRNMNIGHQRRIASILQMTGWEKVREGMGYIYKRWGHFSPAKTEG